MQCFLKTTSVKSLRVYFFSLFFILKELQFNSRDMDGDEGTIYFDFSKTLTIY